MKHSRTLPIKGGDASTTARAKTNYSKANLGNTLHAFAALYVLEKAYMAEVGELSEREAFAGMSELFEIQEYSTSEDIDEIFDDVFGKK